MRRVFIRWLAAGVVGLLLYGSLYAYQEWLIGRHGKRNPFYQVAGAEKGRPYLLVLGASHALPLAFQDMGAVAEQTLGGPILDLALPGAGVLPNSVLLEYALDKLGAPDVRGVVYVLDSFGFYSRQWNEDRLNDVRLWQRAPFDIDLLPPLWRATRRLSVKHTVFWNYLLGFSKINDPTTWFASDTWPDEDKFDQTYRPDAWRDQARLEYLYANGTSPTAFDRYFSIFMELTRTARVWNVPLIVVKPPLRRDFYVKIPDEADFDRRIRDGLVTISVPFYDFSVAGFDDNLFYDPDHLNRRGVQRFLTEYLGPVVGVHLRRSRGRQTANILLLPAAVAAGFVPAGSER